MRLVFPRRKMLFALMAGSLAGSQGFTTVPSYWENWKSAFLHPSGRVIDELQDFSSHSEGQGYGMILAMHADDRIAFSSIFVWTEQHLAQRRDPLLAWRWKPDQHPHISDYNNASDGDLFYAWALLEGSIRFKQDDWWVRSEEIATFLANNCILPDPRDKEKVLFIPALEGFIENNRLVINPSYYMPYALTRLGQAFNLPSLVAAARDGVAFLAELAQSGFMPDWAEVDRKGVRPASGYDKRSGYEALRVPLYLIWSGLSDHPAVRLAVDLQVENYTGETAIMFASDGRVLERSRYSGYAALAALAKCYRSQTINFPPPDIDQPYYPATLHLLAYEAAKRGGCIIR